MIRTICRARNNYEYPPVPELIRTSNCPRLQKCIIKDIKFINI